MPILTFAASWVRRIFPLPVPVSSLRLFQSSVLVSNVCCMSGLSCARHGIAATAILRLSAIAPAIHASRRLILLLLLRVEHAYVRGYSLRDYEIADGAFRRRRKNAARSRFQKTDRTNDDGAGALSKAEQQFGGQLIELFVGIAPFPIGDAIDGEGADLRDVLRRVRSKQRGDLIRIGAIRRQQ